MDEPIFTERGARTDAQQLRPEDIALLPENQVGAKMDEKAIADYSDSLSSFHAPGRPGEERRRIMNGLTGFSFFDMPLEKREIFYKEFKRELDKFMCGLAILLLDYVDDETEVGEHIAQLKQQHLAKSEKRKKKRIPVLAVVTSGSSCDCRQTPEMLDTGRGMDVFIGDYQIFAFPFSVQLVLEACNFVSYYQKLLSRRREQLKDRIEDIEKAASEDLSHLSCELPDESDFDELEQCEKLDDLVQEYERLGWMMDDVEGEVEQLEAQLGICDGAA